MSHYSAPDEVEHFVDEIGNKPFFVCDMDGNVMTGYSLTPGATLALHEGDNHKNQAIPFGTSPDEIENLTQKGILSKGIFAEKAMDARLPKKLVDVVNRNLADGNKFSLAFLTSRSAADALTLLKESGVERPEQVTLVADSGGTLYFDGKKTDVRPLSQEEKTFLRDIEGNIDMLQAATRDAVREQGFDPAGCPELFVEPKGIATNVHYRIVLSKYGQAEGSALDKAIAGALKAHLGPYVESGPVDDKGKKTFKTLDAPAAVEVKIAEINKGHGLNALMRAVEDAHADITSVIFTGDDVAKLGKDGKAGPGTDKYAMDERDAIRAKFHIAAFNIHTHHPAGVALDGAEPDPNKAPELLADAPKIDLTVPTPERLGDLIVHSLTARQAQPA